MTTSHWLIAVVVLLSPQVHAQGSGQIWLDRPLANWNAGVKTFPQPPKPNEPVQKFAARCKLDVRQTSPGGSIGAVRLAPDGAIAAEFVRYTEKDPQSANFRKT